MLDYATVHMFGDGVIWMISFCVLRVSAVY